MPSEGATLQSINDKTGVYTFVQDDSIPMNGTYLSGPGVGVGQYGSITDVPFHPDQFAFVWGEHSPPNHTEFTKA